MSHKRLTKKEFVTILADLNFNGNYSKAMKYLDSITNLIKTQINDGNSVVLPGFGVFKSYVKPAHKARNPATGDSVNVPARTRMTFKPSTHFFSNN